MIESRLKEMHEQRGGSSRKWFNRVGAELVEPLSGTNKHVDAAVKLQSTGTRATWTRGIPMGGDGSGAGDSIGLFAAAASRRRHVCLPNAESRRCG